MTAEARENGILIRPASFVRSKGTARSAKRNFFSAQLKAAKTTAEHSFSVVRSRSNDLAPPEAIVSALGIPNW
jgi:hypothetical protein